jgi:hypothetical protein
MHDEKQFRFPRRTVPPLTPVRYALGRESIEDVSREVRQKLVLSGFLDRINPRARIAITAGSRGGRGFVDLLRGIVDAVKDKGGEPFVIPAMGSHGGATPEGQVEILRRLGVTESSVGAPIKATMQTHALGTSPTGAVAHLDESAFESDGIIVLGRAKTHPENREGIASGLLKMTTVGLGKQAGAQEAHSHGLWDSVRAVPEITLGKSKILCGVGVVENAFRQPAVIEIVEPNYHAFLESDERLLEFSKGYFAELPFQQLDLLIVDEIGKDISGTGMDLNVVGNWRIEGGERTPDFRRIVALSLTTASLGNGLGIGLADFTTRRFVDEFDWQTTYVNLVTATEPGTMTTREGQLPLALGSDMEAIEVGMFSALASVDARVCRIKNTADLEEFFVSDSLLSELDDDERFVIEGDRAPLKFDSGGNLF